MERLSRTLCLTTCLALGLTACATTEQGRLQDPLKRDAVAYCQVYQPEHWQHLDPELGLYEQEAMAQQELRETLQTAEFLEMMGRLDEEVTHYRDLYAETRQAIKALTGETWECPAFERFYDVEYRRSQLQKRLQQEQ